MGLYNGNVAVYNLRSSSSEPCFTSCAATGKHQDVVWQVKWVADNLDGYLNFYSVAGDGRVTNWTIVKVTIRSYYPRLVTYFLDNSMALGQTYSQILEKAFLRRRSGGSPGGGAPSNSLQV